MSQASCKNVQLVMVYNKPLILHSFDEYKEWYLAAHNLSMFSKVDIDYLIEEEQPERYPCTPLLIDIEHGFFYLNMDNMVIMKLS
ncbi:hypothetical protein L6R44_16655 [Enterobacter cloacae complex sp. ECC445]|uniref:hypothetical protein n=1 Tax=Enterobacter cloacae complex sp. ECC445 TaxID=2913213 RepID=UPI001F40132B|nr:hypothetical protein [Enterobacter cloacae complex sp. ECC445]MCG0457704.1 hypothetical protein [Enterobacter cloacae complex sp. ECC445]